MLLNPQLYLIDRKFMNILMISLIDAAFKIESYKK